MSIDNSSLYGIGKGSAQVLQGNPGLQMLQRQIQQEQQRKAAEDAAAQAQLAKIDYNKTREADQDHFIKGYQTIQNTYAQLRNTQDPLQRMRLNNQLNTQQRDFMHAVSLSQQALENEKGLRDYQRDHGDLLKDDYGTQLAGITQKSIFDPSYKDGLTYFNDPRAPKYDTDKLAKEVEGIALRKTEGKAATHMIGGFNVLARPDVTQLDEKAAHDLIIQKAQFDPALRRTIMANYGKNGESPEVAYNNFAESMIAPMRAKNTTKTTVLGSQAPERPDRFYSHYNYELAHPKPNSSTSTELSPAQILATNMKNQVPGSGEKFLSLTPEGQYGTNKPKIQVDTRTGEHVFNFPAQIQIDKKAIEKNNEIKAAYKKNGSGTSLFNRTPVPIEKSEEGKKLLPEAITKVPAKTYRLNPASDDYHAKFSQMAAEQNVNLTKLNQIEGIKGGHGQIAPATSTTPKPMLPVKQQPATNQYKNITQARDAKGNVIQLGLLNGKWYDVKTHKPVQ